MLRRGFVSERTRATRRVAQVRTEDGRSFLLSDSGSGEDGGMLDHARSLALEQAGADESGGGQEAAAMAVLGLLAADDGSITTPSSTGRRPSGIPDGLWTRSSSLR